MRKREHHGATRAQAGGDVDRGHGKGRAVAGHAGRGVIAFLPIMPAARCLPWTSQIVPCHTLARRRGCADNRRRAAATV
jgi:hypothetical protein